MVNLNYEILPGGEFTARLTERFLEEWNNESDFIVQYTSGSTGKPKAVKIKKKNLLASAKATNEFFNLNTTKTAILCISPEYIGGKMMIVRSLLAKMQLLIAEISSTPLSKLNRSVDFCAMVPLQVENSITSLNKIKHIIIGGAPVSLSLENKLKDLKCNAYATFGMTETISHIALRKLNTEKYFTCLGNNSVAVNKDHLIINAPDLEIENLETNDLIEFISKKQFRWLGRADFVINTGGVKINPENIENKISHLFIDQNFIIFGKPDLTYGSIVCLLIETKKDLDLNAIAQELKLLDLAYGNPKEIYTLPFFTRTGNGKINRVKTIESLNFEE